MALDRRLVEDFVVREARLIDEHCYDEWLTLWAEDGVYWVPANKYDVDPTREVSFIYDDRLHLGDRVERLKQGLAFAQDPRSRMRRLVSNIEVAEGQNGEITAYSNFLLVELRRQVQNIWAGRTMHVLRKRDGDLKIALKKVMLVNNDEPIPAFQFIL